MASQARHPQPQLTPRQREVLDLLARGRTNPEIAEALGISLDGAKWHVSEVLSRLGVATREEAAAYWVRERRLDVRFGRAARALFTVGLPGRLGWAVAALGVAAIGAGAVVLALRGDGETPTAPDTPSPTITATPPATPTLPPGACPVEQIICTWGRIYEDALTSGSAVALLTNGSTGYVEDLGDAARIIEVLRPGTEPPRIFAIGCPEDASGALDCGTHIALAFTANPGPARPGTSVVVRYERTGGDRPRYLGFSRPGDAVWLQDGGATSDCASSATPDCQPTRWARWDNPDQQYPDTTLGVPAAFPRVLDPVDFPPNTTMVLARGYGRAEYELWRFTRIGDRAVERERLFPFAPEDLEGTRTPISGRAVSPDGVLLFVSVCEGEGCSATGGAADLPAQGRIVVSRDGGLSWSSIGELDGPWVVTDVAGEDAVIYNWRDPRSMLIPSGTPLDPPPTIPPDARHWITLDGTAFWASGGMPNLLAADGRRLKVGGPDPASLTIVDLATWDGHGPAVVRLGWTKPDPLYGVQQRGYLAVVHQMSVGLAMRAPSSLDGPLLRVADEQLMTTFAWSRPGSCLSQGIDSGTAPAFVDLRAATIQPIGEPFMRDGECFAYWRPLAIVQGDLARVAVGAGDCLNAREEPRADAPSLACWPDGAILLLSGGPTTDAGGREWRLARLGETAGWVAAEFLAR